MRLNSATRSGLASALAGVLLLAACSDPVGGGDGRPQVIEETNFASSLNIDLSSMTKTSSGLYIETISEGTGEPALEGNAVTVTLGYGNRASGPIPPGSILIFRIELDAIN